MKGVPSIKEVLEKYPSYTSRLIEAQKKYGFKSKNVYSLLIEFARNIEDSSIYDCIPFYESAVEISEEILTSYPFQIAEYQTHLGFIKASIANDWIEAQSGFSLMEKAVSNFEKVDGVYSHSVAETLRKMGRIYISLYAEKAANLDVTDESFKKDVKIKCNFDSNQIHVFMNHIKKAEDIFAKALTIYEHLDTNFNNNTKIDRFSDERILCLCWYASFLNNTAQFKKIVPLYEKMLFIKLKYKGEPTRNFYQLDYFDKYYYPRFSISDKLKLKML